jgi:MoaA/NifB/PqqE/SkfB family radical SAM enzyme
VRSTLTEIADHARIAWRILQKDGSPLHLVFFITNICDFACEHCFLIANGELNNKSRQLLQLDEIERVARSMPSLTALSLTGGEPFLRKDYGEIVRTFARHTRLKSLSTVSNGVRAERIVPQLEPLLQDLDLSIFLTISLDGSLAAHDTIRRKPGAFQKSLNTIKELRRLRERYPSLSIGVNSTYIGSNFADLMALYDVLEEVRPHFATLNLLRGVDWTDRPDHLQVDEYRKLNERRRALLKNCRPPLTALQKCIDAKDQVMADLLAETYARNTSIMPCYAGRLMAVLKDNGEVFPCEQLTTPLGNIRDHDCNFEAVWNSKIADQERKNIRDRKCHCTYECVMSSNILFNPLMYPKLLAATFG